MTSWKVTTGRSHTHTHTDGDEDMNAQVFGGCPLTELRGLSLVFMSLIILKSVSVLRGQKEESKHERSEPA